jgi:hypothetical protein
MFIEQCFDPVLVARDEAAADLSVVRVLAVLVEQARAPVQPLDHARADGRLLAQPDRRAEDEDVGRLDALVQLRPVVARRAVLAHVRPHTPGARSWSTARTESTATPFRCMISIEIRMRPPVCVSSGEGLSVQFTYNARRSEKSHRLVEHSSSWNSVNVMPASCPRCLAYPRTRESARHRDLDGRRSGSRSKRGGGASGDGSVPRGPSQRAPRPGWTELHARDVHAPARAVADGRHAGDGRSRGRTAATPLVARRRRIVGRRPLGVPCSSELARHGGGGSSVAESRLEPVLRA